MVATANAALAAAGPRLIRQRNYRWAELMKRVFDLDVLKCPNCHGQMRPVAEIEDPVIARKILQHMGLPADELELAPARGPPEPEERPQVLEDEWM